MTAIVSTLVERAVGLRGLIGLDFRLERDSVWLTEVNPRYTASIEIVERATGAQAIASHTAACRDGKLPSSQLESASSTYGKAILFAKHSVTICAPFADWALKEATQKSWPVFADIPVAGTTINRGHPVLTIFAESASGENTTQILRNRVATIERALYS